MTDQEQDQKQERSPETPEKAPVTDKPSSAARNQMMMFLALINIAFLLMIFIVPPTHSDDRIDDLKSELEGQRLEGNKYKIQVHLTRYVLLRIGIKKALENNTGKEAVLIKIDEAINELEAVLTAPGIENILSASRRNDVRSELKDIKKLKQTYF